MLLFHAPSIAPEVPLLMQKVSGVGIRLNSCHLYCRVERATSQAAGRRSAVAVPSVSVLSSRILCSLDVPSPSNQGMEVVNVKGDVMKTTFFQPEELSETVAMTILQLLVLLACFSTPPF